MKKIPLTQGKFAIVDDRDAIVLNKRKWHLTHYGYAASNAGHGKLIYMHRVISNPPKGREVDHANGNRLDNRRKNLRNVTRRQNCHNTKPRRHTSSRYKGVYFRKDTGRYTAYINKNGVRIRLGCFKKENDAAMAYNAMAKKLFGKYARPNKVS